MTIDLATRVWMTVDQAADYAAMQRDAIYRAILAGALTGYQRVPGGHWRVRRTDIDAWITGGQS